MLRNDNSGTVLLVCSDPVFSRVAEELLEQHGYSVLTAQDIGVAVDWLDRWKRRPDILVIRSHIDSFTGHDAALYLRRKCPGMAVLIVGGLLDDERLLRREAVQGFDIFPQPFTADELLLKVREAIAHGKSNAVPASEGK